MPAKQGAYDPFASTELLRNDFEESNPFAADPFDDPQLDDDGQHLLARNPFAPSPAPPGITPFSEKSPAVVDPISVAKSIVPPPQSSSVVSPKPGPPSKPFLSTLSTYGRPSELPDEAVALLTKILGGDINVRELFSRLERTRQNAEAFARGAGTSIDGVIHDSKRDLSKHMYNEDGGGAQAYKTDEGKPKAPSLAKRAAAAFRKAIGVNPDVGSAFEESAAARAGGVENPYLSGNKPLPPPPTHVHPDDHLSLAIYYHEREELQISAVYLERAAKDRNPLGLYLRALTLRHGWGVPENKQEAFRCLLESAESSLMTIPEVAERRKHKLESPFATLEKSGSTSTSTSARSSTRPADLRSLRSYATVASLLPEDIHTATALLPLPLFEIGICFSQGWGVMKSYPAAT
ncbi:hypothetical protein HDU96_003556, partial [Phlyctochytrium bullatum]